MLVKIKDTAHQLLNATASASVKTSLFIQFTFVPGLAVLSSSSDVGNGQDAPQMSDKDESGDAVARRDGDVKTTVAVQKTWMGAVQLDALLMNDKHGDLSAILGGIEDLAKTWQKTHTPSGTQTGLETEPGNDGERRYWAQMGAVTMALAHK